MKTAVITGGSRGIGKMIAKAMLEDGMKVVIISKNDVSGSQAVEELKSISQNVSFYPVDVSDSSQVNEFFNKIESCDVLINCAGVLGALGPFEENSVEDWKETIDVNLLGTIYCCHAAIPFLKKSERGKIITFAGGGAASPRLFHSAYGTSKAAVVRFTETIAQELKENMDINVIAPGAHNTDIQKEEVYDKPTKWADPERLIETISFFSSSKSDNITSKFVHIYDNWENLKPNISDDDMFSLRRVEDR